MGERVTVKFAKNYIASRGAGISGAKGEERTFAMSDDLKACLDSGVCELVKETKSAKRQTATKKKKEAS